MGKLFLFSGFLILSFELLHAQSDKLTISELENILLKETPILKIENKEIEKQNISLKYARRWNNPNLSYENDINPTMMHKSFGKCGEIILSAEQAIPIGGRTIQKYRLESSNLNISHINYKMVERDLIVKLREDAVGYFLTLKMLKVFQKQISSLEKIVSWYDRNVKGGNVSVFDKNRVQSLLLSINKERLERNTEHEFYEKEIKLILNNDSIDLSLLHIDLSFLEDKNIVQRIDIDNLNNIDLHYADALINAKERELIFEKSNAIPDLNVGFIYDKEGSFIPKYVAARLSIDIPLSKSNQVAIKQAKISLTQAQNRYDYKQKEVKNDLRQNLKKLYDYLDLYNGVSKDINKELDLMFDGINTNFLKGNISLLEFVDYYQTFLDNSSSIIELEKDILLTMETINKLVGERVYEY